MKSLEFYFSPSQKINDLYEASWSYDVEPSGKKELVKHFTNHYFNGKEVNGHLPVGHPLNSSCPNDLVFIGTGTYENLTGERIRILNHLE